MLDLLIKSAVRRKIIGLFAINHTQELYARQVAREIDESPHAVGLELKALVKGGLLTRTEKSGRTFFQWNAKYPYAELLQEVIDRLYIDEDHEMTSLRDMVYEARLQENLRRVTRDIVKYYDPEQIILFGSAAWGKTGRYSDLDVAVVKKTALPFTKRVMQLIDLLDYDVDVDLLVYTPEEVAEAKQSNRFIREEIFEKGKVLYERAA